MTDEWPPKKARSLEDWDAYWERQRWDRRARRALRIRWARIKRPLTKPLGWPRQLRWTIHRARHGWAASDTWGLDDYLAQLIGESLIYLRDHGHGHPHQPDPALPDVHEEIEGEPGNFTNYLTAERWDEILTQMADPLLNYRNHWDWPDGMEVTEKWKIEEKIISDAQAALHLVADWLPSLWD